MTRPFLFFQSERSLKSNNLQTGLPISSCADFKGQVCPSQIVKFSTHLHPATAPKAQENLTKWGWGCQRAAGLSSHQSKPQNDAGPGWQRPCTVTSPTSSIPAQGLAHSRWQPGMEEQQEYHQRKAEPTISWEGAYEPSGFAGGISPCSVLPLHPSSAGVAGSLGWWLLLVWL